MAIITFDNTEYYSITKGPGHKPALDRWNTPYQRTDYMFGAPYDWLRDICHDTGRLTVSADLIIAYEIRPQYEYVFELIDIDTTLPIVGEIKNWCDENLEEYNWLVGNVLKSRDGMPRSYPIFEMSNEEDAVAFKLRWL